MISLRGTVTTILLYYGAVIEEGAVPHKLVMTRQVRDWLHALRSGDPVTRRLVAEAIDQLLDEGPRLGRPLADRISGSRLHNLKELRPGSSGASEVRILFIFDPVRNAVLLVAGDKSGRWQEWYRKAIPAAEAAYEAYLKERR
jgi:hypothetical protein